MTSKELKSEIQKLLDNVPESVLEDLLGYLKQAQQTDKKRIELSQALSQIIREDKELLAKLAQ